MNKIQNTLKDFFNMNKITSLFLPILLATTTHVMGMEQSLDLGDVLRTCPNQIAYHLNGEALSSLTKVSHLFQEVCDAVPTKYLSIFLYDAVKNKNTNLISRLIAQLDSWMFTSEIDNEIIHQEKNGNDTIGLFKCLFGEGVQDFFQTRSFLRLTQNNKTVRYLLTSMDSCQTNKCMIYLNVNECSDAVNIVLKNRLSPKAQNIASTYNVFDFINKPAHGGYVGVDPDGNPIHTCFSLASSLHSTENMLKQFGLITIFLIAAQKNRSSVAYSILNNSKILDSWSSDILEIALYDLDNDDEIKDVVAAVLFERETKK